MKKRKIKKTILNFILISGILILAFLIYALKESDSIIKYVKIESGTAVMPELFSKKWDANVKYSKECPPFYPDKPGIYTVQVEKGLFKYNCQLIIEDTRMPEAKSVDISLPYGMEVTPYDFAEGVYDATELTAAFITTPDMKKLGNQQVRVSFTDVAGNETQVTSNVNVVPVMPVLVHQAGTGSVSAQELVCYGNYEGVAEGYDEIDFQHIGDYYTYVFVDGASYPCHIMLVDTNPPEITVNELHVTAGVDRTYEDFAEYVVDDTDIVLEIDGNPDYMNPGENYITFRVTDEAGNVTEKNMYLYVEEDTEGPEFVVADNFSAFKDETLSYRKYITVEDNSGREITLDVDASKVDTSVIGDYPVIYTATDYSGNETVKELTVSITERTYTDEDLYARIDALLEQIITDDMDERAKARAVYDWARNNIEYTGTSDKHNFNKAAISGLLDFKGDCFTNTTICVACFERLGMKAQVIRKDPIVTMFNHWWLIVKVDGDYYHMDTCPRTRDNPEMFLWTDYQLKTYSAAHWETHNYDRSKYHHVKYY